MTDTVKVLLIGVLLWFALLAYTLYDDWTTWWVSLTFVAYTVLCAVWVFTHICRLRAREYLEEWVSQLRKRHVAPATGDELSRVLAHCILSPTGLRLMWRVAGEPRNVVYSADALSILTAFVYAGAPELPDATLRWLTFPEPWWERVRRMISRRRPDPVDQPETEDRRKSTKP
jgi:hypothetical protein